MNQIEIIILAMILSAIVVFIIYRIRNIIYKRLIQKGAKRVQYIKKLVDDKLLDLKSINIDEEPNRLKNPNDNNGLIVDNILYTEENSYFLEEGSRIYIIGKKEDFCITLEGGHIGKK